MHRLSAIATPMAVDPQYVCGAATGWPRQPRETQSEHVARGWRRQKRAGGKTPKNPLPGGVCLL